MTHQEMATEGSCPPDTGRVGSVQFSRRSQLGRGPDRAEQFKLGEVVIKDGVEGTLAGGREFADRLLQFDRTDDPVTNPVAIAAQRVFRRIDPPPRHLELSGPESHPFTRPDDFHLDDFSNLTRRDGGLAVSTSLLTAAGRVSQTEILDVPDDPEVEITPPWDND